MIYASNLCIFVQACIDLHSYVRISIDLTIMPSKLISIGKASKLLGVSVDSLRRWDKTHRLSSIRNGPMGHRYYRQIDIDIFLRNIVALAEQWALAETGIAPEQDLHCQTRDIFQARLEKLQSDLKRVVPVSAMSLLSAVAGEIGNNSFDHNIGNWPDIIGIYFSYDLGNKVIVLADRGQGILATLKRVKPELTNDVDALKVAFTETISGRLPEARGNGLKFVRDVIVNNPFTLNFETGNAHLFLKENDRGIIVTPTDKYLSGCFAIIRFENLV